jgi:hypothetical protein
VFPQGYLPFALVKSQKPHEIKEIGQFTFSDIDSNDDNNIQPSIKSAPQWNAICYEIEECPIEMT